MMVHHKHHKINKTKLEKKSKGTLSQVMMVHHKHRKINKIKLEKNQGNFWPKWCYTRRAGTWKTLKTTWAKHQGIRMYETE